MKTICAKQAKVPLRLFVRRTSRRSFLNSLLLVSAEQRQKRFRVCHLQTNIFFTEIISL